MWRQMWPVWNPREPLVVGFTYRLDRVGKIIFTVLSAAPITFRVRIGGSSQAIYRVYQETPTSLAGSPRTLENLQ